MPIHVGPSATHPWDRTSGTGSSTTLAPTGILIRTAGVRAPRTPNGDLGHRLESIRIRSGASAVQRCEWCGCQDELSVQPETVPEPIPDAYAQEASETMQAPATGSGEFEGQLQDLVAAENRNLASRGVPAAGVGELPDESSAAGEGDYENWEIDLNRGELSNYTFEDRADAANKVAHEGEHLAQWYDMARMQAGTGSKKGPLARMPDQVAFEAQMNPITECSEDTAHIEEYYDSVYGSGAERRDQIREGYVEDERLTQTRPATRAEYCHLPEERDAWARGHEVTQEMREMAGQPLAQGQLDLSLCDPNPQPEPLEPESCETCAY